jgi:hypothetical protein
MPVIGYLGSATPDANAHFFSGSTGLGETGYVAGENVVIATIGCPD